MGEYHDVSVPVGDWVVGGLLHLDDTPTVGTDRTGIEGTAVGSWVGGIDEPSGRFGTRPRFIKGKR